MYDCFDDLMDICAEELSGCEACEAEAEYFSEMEETDPSNCCG